MSMSFMFQFGGEAHQLSVNARRPELILSVDGVAHRVSEVAVQSSDYVLLTVDDHSFQVWRTWESDRIHLRIGARSFSINYEDAILAAQHDVGSDDILRADMPGVVIDVHCANNDHVSAGDVMMVIESMKMQINIIAPRNGVVETVHLGVNETFAKGAKLVSMHSED